MFGCPDLPGAKLRKPAPVGCDEYHQGGTPFDHCPGWWRRHGSEYDHAREWTVNGRGVFAYAREAADGLQHSWPTVLPEDLPNPLFEAVVVIWTEENRVADQQRKKAEER